ncbi:MAG: DegT/DnrJ/EryC1/StrS family aminotransferase [Bacteroidetes bacterium]|nr:DegT/DnrJ/EryC1/StrS family aminotransferase [Bacteroidota bacterium]
MKIPFSPPYIDEYVEAEVIDSLRSGWITTGPKVLALQQEVSAYCDVTHTLCVNSATSGMMLALHWFGIGPGDEVIVPAYTYCATALTVMHLGAKPIIVDVGDDFCISIKAIKNAISPRTKAIMPVDFAGFPCDYDSILELVENSDVKNIFSPNCQNQRLLGRPLILSDAAHSFGAKYKGRMTGKLADLSVFSFHAVKNLTTAEGGAICINLPAAFNNQDVYSTLKLWSLNGQTKDAFTKSQAGGWKYDIVYQGFKINMPDICAAIGLAQIKQYQNVLLKKRNEIYDYYSQKLSAFNWALVPKRVTENAEGCGHLYPLRIKNCSEENRDRIIEGLAKLEIATNVHFIPLPLLTVFKEQGFKIENTPVAHSLYVNEISLPIYPQLNHEMIDYLVNQLSLLIDEIHR